MSRAAEWRLLERTGALVAQLLFIAAGVYLGNRADAWKEERSHREAARAALANFRREVAANQHAVAIVLPYHTALRDTLRAVERRNARSVDTLFAVFRYDGGGFQGFRPPNLSRTALQLALATQSLSYLPPDLAFGIADAYQQQEVYSGIQQSFMANVFSPAFFRDDNRGSSFAAIKVFLGDAAYQEPALLKRYAALLPRLDSALAAARR